MKSPFEQVKEISFLDLGCSGSLDKKWAELFPLLSYIGFDPNAEECERLKNQHHSYKEARYLPYAIAGEKGTQTMYMTKSIYCYSLLKPNHLWLNRFAYRNLFEEVGTESVECTTLNLLYKEQNIKADIIKLDTQGLELPILKSSNLLLDNLFCVETETGFLENYLGETKYAQVDEFMRSQGFLLFDLIYYRVSRRNELANYGEHQPLWGESLWLFDFIGQNHKPTLEKALKALLICKALKYFDYGLELAKYFYDLELINLETLKYLEIPSNWITKYQPSNSKLGKFLRLLSSPFRNRIMSELTQIYQEEKQSKPNSKMVYKEGEWV